jgi:hypothetical protein
MSNNLRVVSSDLRGLTRLAVEATVGMTDLVETMHHTVNHPLAPRRDHLSARSRGVKGVVFGAIRALARVVGVGVEAALSPVGPPQNGSGSSPGREALLAALNGVLGDHLAATGNPLATAMSLHFEGRPLVLETAAIAATIPKPASRVLLMLHGLCRNDRQWTQEQQDHGSALARDLGCTPLYLRYNSGLHVSTNGRALADLLETLLAQWPEPVESLTILAHSMGGLLARSACHYAMESGQSWPASLRHLVFLGTPHHGSPLERWGHFLERGLEASPFTSPFARLGKLRSAGITDLRHGNLLDGDWQDHDPHAHGRDTRIPVPLPEGVRCYALAATTGKHLGASKGRLLGDGLVPVDSALGRHRDPRRRLTFPEGRTSIGYGMNHLDLLTRPEVYEQIRHWLMESDPGTTNLAP